MSDVHKTLEERDFVEAMTDTGLPKYLQENKVTLYAGFDPTASSLHVGNLLPIMALSHFQKAGHRVIMLVGGATGMVGDPSGRSSERNLQTTEGVHENVAAVRKQLERFLDFEGDNPAVLRDNNEWIGKMTFIDWLRDVGKFFNVNQMLAKESVKSRLGTDTGISYTEFSYMTMQAYDFRHLCEEENCVLQVGGSDQWGNITAGIELTRKVLSKQVFGMTFPLITTNSGEKFGKSAGNAIWLDPKQTSPYKFYQYWINTEDADVARFLKYFTFLPMEEVNEIVKDHEEAPHRREGQRRLAQEMTRIVHGDRGLKSAEQATKVLFGGDIAELSDAELTEIFADVPSTELRIADLEAGINILDIFADTKLSPSKSEARRLVKNGGANINNQKQQDPDLVVTKDLLASESCIILRSGKKNYHLLKFK